jgi:hypothetical protein
VQGHLDPFGLVDWHAQVCKLHRCQLACMHMPDHHQLQVLTARQSVPWLAVFLSADAMAIPYVHALDCPRHLKYYAPLNIDIYMLSALQHSGSRKLLSPICASLSDRSATGAWSVVSSQLQDDEQLVLSSTIAWKTVDGAASRVVPYLFSSDSPVRGLQDACDSRCHAYLQSCLHPELQNSNSQFDVPAGGHELC